jgi:hypothetical protein
MWNGKHRAEWGEKGLNRHADSRRQRSIAILEILARQQPAAARN